MSESEHRNALAGETSPYLLQHAGNPVDWYPWSAESLHRARTEDKPILLSIGYSACHWCHVMAHESFEDDETAAFMNDHFVNIKVDREERPDIDKIYQLAHQLLTRRPGGWPLTMILTPDDRVPFFGGTYFPVEPRYGMPGFKQVLARVVEFFGDNRDEIGRHNVALTEALSQTDAYRGDPAATLGPAPIGAAVAQLEKSYDEIHGGFGSAPKFPHPSQLEWMLELVASGHFAVETEIPLRDMVLHTLRKMGRGGIYDHVGGGFCRYSVDEYWMIPHFEKMLYDNGPLLNLYAEAWQLTGEPAFRRIVDETGDWVMREMQSPEGGYYSSLDADSEGEEGKFYVWDREAVRALLTDDEYQLVAARFGLDRNPNFEGRHWHLHAFRDGPDLARDLGRPEAELEATWDSARAKLFEARAPRVRPGRDDKVLGSWNGLMITGMATAGRITGRRDFVESAERALDFVQSAMFADGRLHATYKDGRAHLNAYLDDYAFLLEAALALLQIRWRGEDLEFCVALADAMLERFEDREHGGFFFTADDHEALIHRSKPMADEALPAGNGVAGLVLGRLGHLLGESRYLDAAASTLKAAWPALQEYPHAHCTVLRALDEHLEPPRSVVLRGEPEAIEEWRQRCLEGFDPHRITLAIPADAGSLPGLLAERRPAGPAVAYLCEGLRCEAPITDRTDLERALAEAASRPA